MKEWRVLTAMATPFGPDLSLDAAGARKLARHLAATGSDAIVVAGSTGESPTLTFDEKLELFRTVREATGSQTGVVAGCGSNSTADTVRLSREAEKVGVDGIMLVAPYYNKPPQEALYRHFVAVAEAVSIPIMVYNVPGRTGVNLLPDTVARLAAVPNIVAIKEASGNLDQVSEVIRVVPDSFAVFSGDDSLTLPIMAIGGHGVVSVASHVAGQQIRAMILAYEAGCVSEARRLHKHLLPLFKAMFVTSNPIPLKAALALLGLPGGGLRPPLVAATVDEVAVVRSAMKTVGIPVNAEEAAL